MGKTLLTPVIKEPLWGIYNEATELKFLPGIRESSIKVHNKIQLYRTVETCFMAIYMSIIFLYGYLEKGFTEYFNYCLH